jgi:hypothetical protein
MTMGQFERTKKAAKSPIELHMGTRVLTAAACQVHKEKTNILQLDLPHSWIWKPILLLSHRLPLFMRKWLWTRQPEWFLPSTMILKTMKEGWSTQFEREIEAYTKLEPIQGIYVPEFIERVTVGEKPAFLLTYYEGWDVQDRGRPRIPTLQKSVQETISAFVRLGLIHLDLDLQNLRYVREKKRVIIIDWELWSMFPADQDRDNYVEAETMNVVWWYNETHKKDWNLQGNNCNGSDTMPITPSNK